MKQIIKCYPDGKYKALTMSYDDGRSADRRLVDLFNRHGIRSSFHLNSGLLGQEDRLPADEIASLYAGHEVSAHTVTHPTIARSPKEAQVHEVLEDRRRLERLVGYGVRGMSYPNGSYNRQVKELLPHLGIEYGRTTRSSGGFGMPDDLLEWSPTCHHNGKLMELAEQFAALRKWQRMYLMYVWGHSYEFDEQNNWELIERFCEFIGGRDDIWYATNIEIVDYLNACDRLRFSTDCSFVFNPSATSVWMVVDGEVLEAKGGMQTSIN